MAFSETPTVIESLTVQKKLAQGKFKVYEVSSSRHNTTFALKVFPQTDYGITQYAKEKLMFHLSHPNIIQCIPTTCHQTKFYTILTEYAKYGDFFDVVTCGLLSNEVLVRTYFHQLVKGVEYMHAQGVAHLDLKLENLMMGSDCLLKIIDFDQSQPIADQRMTSGGTDGYRAPEVRNSTCKNLGAVDIYSAGIILYTFLAQEFPFVEIEDPQNINIKSYSTFAHNNRMFWAQKAKKIPALANKDFVELVNGMLNADPEKRFTIKDIKNSKWYNGPTFDLNNIEAEMKWKCEARRMRKEGRQ